MEIIIPRALELNKMLVSVFRIAYTLLVDMLITLYCFLILCSECLSK